MSCLPDCVTRVSNDAVSDGRSNEARQAAVSNACAADSRGRAGQIGGPKTPLSSWRDNAHRDYLTASPVDPVFSLRTDDPAEAKERNAAADQTSTLGLRPL